MGVGIFVQPAAQCVVGVVNTQADVVELHQAVEQVPLQLAVLAVVPAAGLVAAFVVFVVGAGVFAQQVVHQFVALGVLVQRALVLLVFFIQQVAGRVVEPLQAAVGVGGHGQVAVVGEPFGLGGAAQACGAFDEAACGVELDVGGALAVDGWTWRTMFFTSS